LFVEELFTASVTSASKPNFQSIDTTQTPFVWMLSQTAVAGTKLSNRDLDHEERHVHPHDHRMSLRDPGVHLCRRQSHRRNRPVLAEHPFLSERHGHLLLRYDLVDRVFSP
jgi:hypothetical protein